MGRVRRAKGSTGRGFLSCGEGAFVCQSIQREREKKPFGRSLDES